MGCFSTPKCEERGTGSLPRYGRGLGREAFSLLSNKPVELPDPRSLEAGRKVVVEGVRKGGRSAFSGPLVRGNVEVEARGAATANYFSADDGKKVGLRSLRRATSFGGRPQPLPLPAGEETPPRRAKTLYLPAPEGDGRGVALPAPEEAMTRGAGMTLFAPSRGMRSFKLEDGAAGSWSSRRGRVAPVGGLPLPPPSVASKLLPSVAAFEFREIQLATEDFAESFCLERAPFGAVYSARLKDASENFDLEMDAAVLRLPENGTQGFMEWKADVQLLAQLSNPNLCAVKGYCTHERLINRERIQERLLVFEQPSNGTLYDNLFGSPGMSYLDWMTRIDIALGAARGLLYIHDRAPLQIVYKEFKAAYVLLDEDYSPKLAGYGLSAIPSPANRQSLNVISSSPAHAKQNIWSFGILLLELLTGKNSREARYFGDDNNFVQWGKQFFKDETKLSHIIDPRMKAVCPVNGAMEVVTLLLQCVNKKEALRPSMSEVVATLKVIKANHGNTSPQALRGKTGLPSWVLSPKRSERQTRHMHSYSDMQTSSDASSSSENEDIFVSKVSPRALRIVV
ncbi:hypothetical protein M758_11G129800 [Ceratodon purpureus]|nr:hypothetical protein M758_11G129800 [Ceratodon purpureus]